MVTKYDTGDEVLAPVTIVSARLYGNEIYYEVKDYFDGNGKPSLLPEGLIEGKARVGRDEYNRKCWEYAQKERKASSITEELANVEYSIPVTIGGRNIEEIIQNPDQ